VPCVTSDGYYGDHEKSWVLDRGHADLRERLPSLRTWVNSEGGR